MPYALPIYAALLIGRRYNKDFLAKSYKDAKSKGLFKELAKVIGTAG